MPDWTKIDGATRVAAALGCWGCKTGEIRSEGELVRIARIVYDLPDDVVTPLDAAERIAAIPKADRKRLVYDALSANWPAPCRLWPDRINGRSPPKRKRIEEPSEPVGLDPIRLLRRLVSVVISAGRGDLLRDVPGILEYYGARDPAASDESAGAP